METNTHLNLFKSIVPSEMSNRDLQRICTEIQIAKNHKKAFALIRLSNGLSYKVDITRHKDYENEFKTVTGKVGSFLHSNQSH